MSDKPKTQETPVNKYTKVVSDLKHARHSFEIAKRNVLKLEKELSNIEKKIWICPLCNKPHNKPSKKETKVLLESREEQYEKGNPDTKTKYYKCKYAYCDRCDTYALIEQIPVIDEDSLEE